MTTPTPTDIGRPESLNAFMIDPPSFVVTCGNEEANATKNCIEIKVSVALAPGPEQHAWLTVQQHQSLVEVMGRTWKRLPDYKSPRLTSEPED